MKFIITVDEDDNDNCTIHSELDLNSSINSFMVTLDRFTDQLAHKVQKAAIAKGATKDNYGEIVLQLKFSDIDSL